MEKNNDIQTPVIPFENNEGDVVVEINKEIEDIQNLLNEKQKQTEDTEEIEKNEALAKEAAEIIQGTFTEGEILAKLKNLHEKIAFKQTETEEELETNKAPEQTESEQEAVDIIHSAERGVLMFISNHTKKVAESLGVAILPTDTPNAVIEKFKRRLGYPLPEETKEHSFISEKALPSSTETEKNNQEETPHLQIPEQTQKEKEEKDLKKEAEIKKQLEKMIILHKDAPAVLPKKIVPVQIKISNIPRKETDKTISDLILSKLNIPKDIPTKPKSPEKIPEKPLSVSIPQKPTPPSEAVEPKKETFEDSMKKLTEPYEVENDGTLSSILKFRLGKNAFFNKITAREQNFVLDGLNDAIKRSSKEQIQKMGVLKDADHINKGETLKLEPLFNRNTTAYRILERGKG
ncbi:MAG: hypothetical protein NTZ13_01275 [Candidatus Parcubacteria bacterium]|nr:hypothetical protein [Candidatus Parcubacteria bacterium]